MKQSEILNHLVSNTHSLFTPDFVQKVNDAFGTNILCREYEANPSNPKGLTLDNNAKTAWGMACFNLAPILCSELGVEYESKLGRGFQVRSCVEALKAAGYPKD